MTIQQLVDECKKSNKYGDLFDFPVVVATGGDGSPVVMRRVQFVRRDVDPATGEPVFALDINP